MKVATIQIPKKKKDELNQILSSNEFYDEVGRDEVIAQFTAKFPDSSIEADIKICNGDGPYIDAVLFDNGYEVMMLEPSWEISEEYIFETDDETYKVLVEII